MDARDFFDHVDELINTDRFARTKVDRLQNIRVHDFLNAFEAVVNVHEASGLVAGAPDFDLVLPCQFGFDYFAANRSRSLFAATEPGTPRAIDIVKAGYAGVKSEIFTEVAAHTLGEKFLPAVTVFGQRGVSVLFFQRRRFEGLLLVAVVNAGRRRVKKAGRAMLLGSLQHVCVNQY